MDHRLARLLDTPFLARIVPRLAPETLHQLIQYGDSMRAAARRLRRPRSSPPCSTSIWRHAQPGPFDGAQGRRDEQFDVNRFGEWLEMLVDTGESVAARTVAALDTHLVIVGLSRYLRVFDRARSNRQHRVMTSRWIATR